MSYFHLTSEERYVISHLALYGLSLREIGRRLNRHHTTISREIKRNRPTYADDAVYWCNSLVLFLELNFKRQKSRRQALIKTNHHKVRPDC